MTPTQTIIVIESTKHGLSVKGNYKAKTVAVSAWQAGANYVLEHPEMMREQFLAMGHWLDENIDYHGSFTDLIEMYLEKKKLSTGT